MGMTTNISKAAMPARLTRAHLCDGAWGHPDEGEEHFDLCGAVEGAKLARYERQLVFVPGQVRARPSIFALQLVEQVVHGLVTLRHGGLLHPLLF